jgi:FkbM family methyltransferase
MNLRKITWGGIRWKLREKYILLRTGIGPGTCLWEVEPGVRFVARRDDSFSRLLYVCGGHEKAELKWCARWLRDGDTVVDCGANIGFFSAFLAQRLPRARIVAVEGNARTATLCRENFALLGLRRVRLCESVLTESSQRTCVIANDPGREPWQRATDGPSSVDTPPTMTLDELLEQEQAAPSLVKIDCEGFESFILRGAARTLAEVRPAWMIECNTGALRAAGSSREELFSILRNHSYRTFHLGSFDGHAPFGVPCDESFAASEFNFAAIPDTAEHLKRWAQSLPI